MPERDILIVLDDILEAIDLIEHYNKNLSIADFQKDTKTRHATLRNLEIIGEACKLVPDTIKDSYKDIPWKKNIGLRNIDFTNILVWIMIWYIITVQLPEVTTPPTQVGGIYAVFARDCSPNLMILRDAFRSRSMINPQ